MDGGRTEDAINVAAAETPADAAELDAGAQTNLGANAEAQLTVPGASEQQPGAGGQRKRGRPRTGAKKQGPLRAPGAYVYDEVEAACQSD